MALQITNIEVRGPDAANDLRTFEAERERLGVALVSCRLSHEQLRESMLLEDRGFRFVEMLYRPEADLKTATGPPSIPRLTVLRSRHCDLPALLEIAGSAFRSERFHVDPRLGPALGNRRYRNWVGRSHVHSSQQLFAIWDQTKLVAFFVTEMLADHVCYWHLTAISPDVQGLGYGRRAWLTMMDHARDAGATRVRTSVAARNHRVINLYGRLGFVFSPPLMTFHWIKESGG